jgi:hypothetical protein
MMLLWQAKRRGNLWFGASSLPRFESLAGRRF